MASLIRADAIFAACFVRSCIDCATQPQYAAGTAQRRRHEADWNHRTKYYRSQKQR
jgi:hypothetical protein